MLGALSGLKILDFSTLLPGPYATMCMADMGADVLRVVSGTRFQFGTDMPPFIPGTDMNAASAYLLRNKRCITLNLKDERAQEIIRKLINAKGYDIIIEQFRPGVMGRLKLDYETLRSVKSDIIYCSLTGYGQTGPMVARAGHDINYIARSGIASYSGRKRECPSLSGMQIADVASGSYNSIIGILSAVIARKTTGKGQYIDISLTDGMIAFNAFLGAGFLVAGKDLEPEGTYCTGGGFYDFYETKDGRYISFGGLEPQFFSNFCYIIGRPDLIPGGVAPDEIKEIKEEVRTILKTKTQTEWMALFNETDACVEPVLTLTEVFHQDSLARERGMIVNVPLPSGQKVQQIANPIKFSETKQEYKSEGIKALSGGHTKEVLRELDYAESEIETFAKTGLFD